MARYRYDSFDHYFEHRRCCRCCGCCCFCCCWCSCSAADPRPSRGAPRWKCEPYSIKPVRLTHCSSCLDCVAGCVAGTLCRRTMPLVNWGALRNDVWLLWTSRRRRPFTLPLSLNLSILLSFVFSFSLSLLLLNPHKFPWRPVLRCVRCVLIDLRY